MVLAVIEGVVNELLVTLLCEYTSNPPVAASYQLKVPDVPVDADSVAVEPPHVPPSVTVTAGGGVIVAVTAARPLVQLPLLKET